MASEFPQLAFTQWLSKTASRIAQAIRHDEAQQAFLTRSVDFADFERRQRALQIGHAGPRFW